MNALKRWRERVQNLLQSPERRLTRRQRAMRYAIELPLHCFRELRHDRAGQMAAALTYHTLFSLLPTLVLGMLALNAFVDKTERDHFKDSVVEIILPATIADNNDQSDDSETARRRRELHEGRQLIANKIETAMDSISNLHFGGIGIAGVLVFIYGATALLSTVERSFNAIFGATRARPWYIRLPLYYTVITLGPVLILMGQWLQNWLQVLFENGSIGWFTGTWIFLSPLLSTWLVVFAAYVLIPHTRVRFRAALIGSGTAALLILLFVEGFRVYVRVYIGSTAVETIYGALALLPLCLLWLYLVWLIILFGVEITHTLQAMKGRSFKHQAHRLTTDMVIDPIWIIPLAARIAKSFARGHSPMSPHWAKAWDFHRARCNS